MATETGALPPRYRSPERIARGGMGDIFVATDELLGRRVAVKVLFERYALDPGIRARFKREGLAAARLSGQPGAVTIFDVGEWDGRPFIVMEYVPGGSLEDRLREDGAQPPARALRWIAQAAAAIDAAHRNGVVHRDLKPANLLLDASGNVHVADFGIASAAGLGSLTLTGTVLGTAGYLSPEQARGERAGPASDRYALAVVAYELLSGERPFASDSVTAEAAAHAYTAVPPISERSGNLPHELDAVFERALAKDPSRRYATAAEFAAALRDAPATAAGATRVLTRVAAPAVARPRVSRRDVLLPAAVLAVAAAVGALIAVLVSATGNDNAARSVTETVIRQRTVTAPSPPPPPAPPAPPAPAAGGHALNDQGYQLIQQGNYAAAIPLLQQSVRKLADTGPADPYEAYANYNLGYALFRSGSCSEAIPYLRRAQRLEPDRPEPASILRRTKHC